MLGLGNSLAGGSPSGDEFLPSSISNLSLWLRNATGLTGDPVSQWDDQSGNDNHAAQSTSGKRGDLIGGGVHLEQSAGDHYDLASKITISADHNFLIGFVMTIESYDGTQNCILSDANTEFVDFNAPEKIRINCSSNTTVFEADSAQFSIGTQVAVVVSRNNGSTGTIQVFVDGAQPAGSFANNDNALAIEFSVLGARAGSGRFFDGTVHEMVVYDMGTDTHTAGELTSLNSYFTSKFGL